MVNGLNPDIAQRFENGTGDESEKDCVWEL